VSKKAIECVDCQTGVSLDSLRDRIIVGDKIAHIPGLEKMVDEVTKMRLPGLREVGDELLRRVKAVYNIPSGEEIKYRRALLDFYDQRLTAFA
jgi:hypothetical protein